MNLKRKESLEKNMKVFLKVDEVYDTQIDSELVHNKLVDL